MTFNQTDSFQIKSQLAKLLSAENIIVQHNPGARTAYFDVKNRVLTLPVWKNISEDLYDMLVVHETGHALDTPTDGWMSAIDTIAGKYHAKPSSKAKSAVKNFLNVIEDARIDKRQKRRYPGSKVNYVRGYKELLERDFFGIQNKDVNTLGLIDRLNLYFKTTGIVIKFSKEEQAFVNKIASAETFEDVVAITEEVYGYAVTKKEEQEKQTELPDDISFDDDESDESSEYDFDDAETEESDEESDSDNGDESADDDVEESEDDESTTAQAESKDENDAGPSNDGEEYIPESETERAAQENVDTIIENSNVHYIYCTLPKPNMDLILDDYTKVIPQMEASVAQFDRDRIEQDRASLIEWKRKENDTISFMVKEFEMKKSADTYARTSIAKTGVIDTNKLHSYKYNDDIFRKLAITPTGKNHGFVMVLDWSGSMAANLESTMKQLFSLTMFCKRVQIPFEVYLFRNTGHLEDLDVKAKGGSFTVKEGDVDMNGFKLRNVLSSRMNTATFNKALECLWAGRKRGLDSDVMDSTPLNQAILCLDQVVKLFQKRNKVQIVNTIILTDGASAPAIGIHGVNPYNLPYGKKIIYTIRDEVTGMTYTTKSNPRNWYTDGTSLLLRILKSRTNTNLIGFYLYNKNIRNLYKDGICDHAFCTADTTIANWRNNGHVSLTSAGYDEYYIINVRKGNDSVDALNVDATMTKTKIAKEFMKFSGKKSINRVLLSRFIDRISKVAA